MDTPSLPPSVATPATPPSIFHRILGILPTLSILPKARTIAALSAMTLGSGTVNAQTELFGWDFEGFSAWGLSPQPPKTSSPNLTVVGLTRGSGVGISGTAAGNTWGANDWNATATAITTPAAAIADGAFATFSVAPKAGYKFSISGIAAYNVRRSSTGPTIGLWQYSVDGTTFTDIGTQITWGNVTSGTSGNAQGAINLSGITALQDVAEGTTVTFRLINWGASGTGTWYLNNFQPGNDLIVNGAISSTGNDLPPSIISPFSPADNATAVLIGTNLTASFSENVVPITGALGSVKLYKTTGDELVESFTITSPQISISANTLTVNPTANLEYSTDYYLTIDAGIVEDATGNDFAGLSLATDWNFTTEAAPLPPSVVINKYLNAATDLIELLVVGAGVPGENVDLRGMIIKDFSSNMASDSGGTFTFTTNELWASVPVGTLIVLSNSSSSTDTLTAGFNLSVGLTDPAYFNKGGGTFDISTTDMVMIKSFSASASGVTGGIHALAGGTAGAQFTSFTGAKLLSPGTTGTGFAAIATNPTSTLADFSGSAATSAELSPSAFGAPNNTENLVYINSLRGIIPGDGSGQASITNATAGPFTGLTMFDDAQTDNQSVKISVTAQVPNLTLTTVEITVPTAMGVASGATVSGAGAGTPVVNIASQVITISGLAVTNSNLIEITVNGLDTPVTTTSDNGNQVFSIKTAVASGTLTPISSQPVAYVIIPIEAIRDTNQNGVPLDLNTIVAVEGVCTHARAFTNNTLAFLQNANFGMAIFNSSTSGSPLAVGNNFAVLGTVSQFAGVTQVLVSSFTNVVNLGPGTNPTPLVITIPDLLINPELYEGRLVTVEKLSSGAWTAPIGPATSVTVPMVDSAANSLNVSITNGSGAATGVAGIATITGIFSQSDTSSPFTSSYQLLPRQANDVQPVLSGYATWITSFFPNETNPQIIGFNADPDGDGIPNGIEALSGGNPNASGVFTITELTKTGSAFTLLYPQDKSLPGDLTVGYEWSTDMINWQNSGASFGGVTVTLADELWDDTDLKVNIYQVAATVTAGSTSKMFIRVKAVKP